MLTTFWSRFALGAAMCTLLITFNPVNGEDGAQSAVQVPIDKAFYQATWRITANWDNGVSGSFDMTFRDDGTCYAGSNTGRFFQVGPRYVWAFNGVSGVPDWSIAYAGEVSANGTTLVGIEGWSHTSGSPKGTHSGSRAFSFVAEKSKLIETAPGVVVGQPKK